MQTVTSTQGLGRRSAWLCRSHQKSTWHRWAKLAAEMWYHFSWPAWPEQPHFWRDGGFLSCTFLRLAISGPGARLALFNEVSVLHA